MGNMEVKACGIPVLLCVCVFQCQRSTVVHMCMVRTYLSEGTIGGKFVDLLENEVCGCKCSKMVRKTLKNIETRQTPCQPKRHKITEKEHEKAEKRSCNLNESKHDRNDDVASTSISKYELQNKQSNKELETEEAITQEKNADTSNKKKTTIKRTVTKQGKEKNENASKKRKASTYNNTRTKKQKSVNDDSSCDDDDDDSSNKMPQTTNKQRKVKQTDKKLNNKTATRKSKSKKQESCKNNDSDLDHSNDNDLRHMHKKINKTASISKKSFDHATKQSPQKEIKSQIKSPSKLIASKASPVKTKTSEHLPNKNDGGCHGNASEENSGDESDDIDWEDVQEADGNHGTSDVMSVASSSVTTTKSEDRNVEISIEIPGMKGKKRKKVQEDLMTRIQKAMAKFQKEIQLNKHKVHLLMLISVGFHRNTICNQPSIQAWCLSYVPDQFISKPSTKWKRDDIVQFLSWFKEKFSALQKINFDILKNAITSANHLPRHLAEVLVAFLRSLGLLTRLVFSLQPVPMKLESKSKNSKIKKTPQSSKKSAKVVSPPDVETIKKNDTTSPYFSDGSAKVKTPSAENKKRKNKTQGSTGKNAKTPKTNKTSKSDSISNKSLKEKLKPNKQTASKLRKKKKVDYIMNDTESGDDNDNNESDYVEETHPSSSDNDDDEIFEETKTMRTPKLHKTPKAKNTPKVDSGSSKNKSPLVVDLLDDDDDFEVSSKPLMKKKRSTSPQAQKRVQMLSSDEDDSNCGGNSGSVEDFWVEVYLSSAKAWSCIDMQSFSIDQPQLCEEHLSQPVTYMLGYDNDHKVKDVTGRYASAWLSKTQKMRIDSDWWEETLLPYKTKKKKMDETEDALLLEQHQEKPMPQSINEYKNHPLYVLKRHLLKFEAIYPESAATLGFIRGEAIYSRDCVHLLHTREKWMSLDARVVKKGEEPYKIVKGRVKRNQPVVDPNSVTIDLFGRWQTEDYKPPPAKDGIVPRNEYGNVELFKPSMLPPGTKHIQIPGIQKIAKKLGIDGAPAVVGFDFHCGFCHPIIDGLVVCKESVPTLMDAWRQEQKEAQRRKEEKREKRVLGNWKLIVKSLLIREKLKKKYDRQESTASSEMGEVLEDEKISEAIAWPQNMKEGKTSVADEGHVHVFPKKLHKKDKITGEWTKACSCGHTLPLDK